jgi:hypothetical protein
MDELIQRGKNNQLKSLNREDRRLSDKTLRVYRGNITKLYRECNKEEIDILDLRWVVNNVEKIDDYIKMNYKPSCRKNMYSVLIALMYVDDRYNKERDILIGRSMLNYEERDVELSRPNIEIERKLISLEEYKNFVRLLEVKHYKEYVMLRMIECLYCRNEIGTLILIEKSEFVKLDESIVGGNNWLVMMGDGMVVYRYKYKSAGTNGLIKSDICVDVIKIVKEYIKRSGLKSGEKVFGLTEQQVSARLSYVSEGMIGVKLSTSSIFKILVSNVVDSCGGDIKRITERLKEIGALRGTSLKILLNYYVYNVVDKEGIM